MRYRFILMMSAIVVSWGAMGCSDERNAFEGDSESSSQRDTGSASETSNDTQTEDNLDSSSHSDTSSETPGDTSSAGGNGSICDLNPVVSGGDGWISPVNEYTAALSDDSIEVLYFNSFDHNTSGQYVVDEWRADWWKPAWENNITYNYYANVVDSALGKSLNVSYPQAAGTTGGVKWRTPLGETYNELYLSYNIQFSADWDGGLDGGKLPGVCGGACPSGGDCEGGPCISPTEGFSVRLMFDGQQGESVRFYSYFNNKYLFMGEPWCNPPDYQDYNCRYAASVLWNVTKIPGQWHTITQRVVMNTPGNADGFFEGFFDGVLVAAQEGVVFRPEGETFGIEYIMFETFFGGSNGPQKDENLNFDNMSVFRYTAASGEVIGDASPAGRVLKLPPQLLGEPCD